MTEGDIKIDKQKLSEGLDKILESGVGPKAARFGLGVLGGLVPLVGGVMGSIAGAWSEKEQSNFDKLVHAWLKLQEEEIKEIGITIMEIMIRLDQNDENVRKRIESPEYLKLVKKCFRDWSAAESEEKRTLIRNLLANAASTRLCSDDVIRMFIQWVDIYSEAHFAVIREIYKTPGITRGEIWQNIHGEPEKEDSAEADLFKLLIHDLSTGHVIRQHREVDYYGNFIKQSPSKHRSSSKQLTSAFDDSKQYELTELGKQFIHYTMNEIVPRITERGKKDGG